jgi:hypothetical protein
VTHPLIDLWNARMLRSRKPGSRFEEAYGPEYLIELREEEFNDLWDEWQQRDEERVATYVREEEQE